MKTRNIIDWVARIVAAVILLQTLFFKFTGHPDSVLLFSQLGVEPFGRIGLGVAELIVAVLLLIPKTAWLGIIGTIGLMIGAIGTHLFAIGINFNNDGGALFTLAVIAFTAALVAAYLRKDEILGNLKSLFGSAKA